MVRTLCCGAADNDTLYCGAHPSIVGNGGCARSVLSCALAAAQASARPSVIPRQQQQLAQAVQRSGHRHCLGCDSSWPVHPPVHHEVVCSSLFKVRICRECVFPASGGSRVVSLPLTLMPQGPPSPCPCPRPT